jgi:hypothetical protein
MLSQRRKAWAYREREDAVEKTTIVHRPRIRRRRSSGVRINRERRSRIDAGNDCAEVSGSNAPHPTARRERIRRSMYERWKSPPLIC